MATGVLGTNARQDPRQVVNTLKKTVNYNDPGIATGVAFDNYLPQNAFIENVLTEVVVAFNAGTTNVLTAGTNGPSYNNIVYPHTFALDQLDGAYQPPSLPRVLAGSSYFTCPQRIPSVPRRHILRSAPCCRCRHAILC